jgi:phosphocarrier protein
VIEKELLIINKLGLHARAAAKFVNASSRFISDIWVICRGQKVQGKSIMGLMMLMASKGTTIKLIIDGDDETEALSALEALINNYFGEGQ